MSRYTLIHLTDSTLLRDLKTLLSQERSTTTLLIAERFPQPDLPTLVTPLAPAPANSRLVPEPVNFSPAEHPASMSEPRSRVAPLAPQRFAVQFTMDQEAHDDLLYAQALLGHAVPNGDPAQVFARALKALIAKLEQQKFAKTSRPRPCHVSDNARHIPADVKHTVWERDGGQCTFVGENGHCCEARALAGCCEGMPDAPLEARVRPALKCLARPVPRRAA
jgi:hypothetical protein